MQSICIHIQQLHKYSLGWLWTTTNIRYTLGKIILWLKVLCVYQRYPSMETVYSLKQPMYSSRLICKNDFYVTFICQKVSNRKRGKEGNQIYGMSKVQRKWIASQLERAPLSYFPLSKLSGRKVNVLHFCTDLCTEPERRNTLWQSWIDRPQPSPEGRLTLRTKHKHTV